MNPTAANAPLLVFVHLRKTAGTTVSYVMWRQFRGKEIVNLNAPSLELAHQKWHALPAERRAEIKAIRGHLPFSRDLFAPRQTTCFTLLRDPVERVISEYYFQLRNASEKLHSGLIREGLTLDQFVRGESFADVHNTQTRMLAGAPAQAAPGELLELAWVNLRDRIRVFGMRERFDESMLLFRQALGWRWIIYRPVNVNHRRPSIGAVDAETVQAIERANALDRELYSRASSLFEERLRESGITESQVRALGRISRAYGGLRRTIGMPREIWIEARMAIERHRVASRIRSGQPGRS